MLNMAKVLAAGQGDNISFCSGYKTWIKDRQYSWQSDPPTKFHFTLTTNILHLPMGHKRWKNLKPSEVLKIGKII